MVVVSFLMVFWLIILIHYSYSQDKEHNDKEKDEELSYHLSFLHGFEY